MGTSRCAASYGRDVILVLLPSLCTANVQTFGYVGEQLNWIGVWIGRLDGYCAVFRHSDVTVRWRRLVPEFIKTSFREICEAKYLRLTFGDFVQITLHFNQIEVAQIRIYRHIGQENWTSRASQTLWCPNVHHTSYIWSLA